MLRWQRTYSEQSVKESQVAGPTATASLRKSGHIEKAEVCVYSQIPDSLVTALALSFSARQWRPARCRGVEWLHVDFDEELEPFYRAAGFSSTSAGLLRLHSPDG